MSNPKFSAGQFPPGETHEQMKRRKLRREMIFGQKAQPTSTNTFFAKMQKEDLQNQFRNLKIQNNMTKDENMKLKTKIQQIQQELNQRDKELEKLTLKLQQTFMAPNIGDNSKVMSQLNESFIVSQLKKNNRDLKQEVLDKDRLIEQLKRNIKLSKTQEIEVELTVYIDECLRLRTQLEQVTMEKNVLAQ